MTRRAPDLGGVRARRALGFVVALALLPTVLLMNSGCSTDGTTPDCTLPDTHCGPDVDGAFGDALPEGAVFETGADTDAADAGVDASDASGDAKIDGDARPG